VAFFATKCQSASKNQWPIQYVMNLQ